ncbi:MAG: winged helix-turn-helix domain-containing protein, partial [Acidobacteriota bacterium]
MSEPFDVGPWRVEPELLRVRRGDAIRNLAPKAMAVLEVLAAQRGEVVGREVIDRTVWQGDIVGEDVLRRTISDLRKALDDDARAPRHIETVPRRGYRLLHDPEPDVAPDEPGGNRSWALPMAVAAAAGLALLAVLGVTLAPNPEHEVRPPWPSTPLTSAPGAEVHPALSRDGRRVAYVAGRPGGAPVLQVQDLDAAAPLAIEPSIEGRPAFPTWSPDGRRLAWAEQTPSGWRLVVRPLLSAVARTVAEVSDRSIHGLAWSPTTDALAVVVRRPGMPSRIERFDLGDGSWRPLTEPPSTSGGDTRPTWSPDGRHVAVVRERVQGSQAIHLIDAATGSDRQLIDFAGKVPGLAWDGDVLVLNRFLPADRRGIWRLDPETGELDALPIGARFPTQLTAAAGRLVFVDGSFRGDLVVLDSAGTPRSIASSTFWDGSPQLSPDGRRLAFASLRSGAAEIWVADLDGSPPRRLTNLGATRGGFVSNPRWSPDGRRLVFDARGRDASHVFVVEVDAPGPARERTPPP